MLGEEVATLQATWKLVERVRLDLLPSDHNGSLEAVFVRSGWLNPNRAGVPIGSMGARTSATGGVADEDCTLAGQVRVVVVAVVVGGGRKRKLAGESFMVLMDSSSSAGEPCPFNTHAAAIESAHSHSPTLLASPFQGSPIGN